VGVALVTLRDVTYVHQYEDFNPLSVITVFLGCFALSFVSVWRVHHQVSSVTFVYSLLISLNVSILNLLTVWRVSDPKLGVNRKRILPMLYLALFVILVGSYFVRQFA